MGPIVLERRIVTVFVQEGMDVCGHLFWYLTVSENRNRVLVNYSNGYRLSTGGRELFY